MQLLALAGLCLAGVAALWQRQHAAGPAPRRPAALLVDSFGAALVMVAALLLAGAFQAPGFEIIRLLTFGVVGLAPLAFLLGLLDARLARSGVADMVVRLNAEPPVGPARPDRPGAAGRLAHRRLLAARVRQLGRRRTASR